MMKLIEKGATLNDLIETCNGFLEKDPKNMQALRLRSVLFNMVKAYDEAITDLDIIISSLPDENDYYLRGDCHFNKKEYVLAKQDYLNALKIELKEKDPEFVALHTEEIISKTGITYETELEEIEKILEAEKYRIASIYDLDKIKEMPDGKQKTALMEFLERIIEKNSKPPGR